MPVPMLDVEHESAGVFNQSLTGDGNGKVCKDDRPTILITTVDIGGGKSDKLEVRRGDDPTDVARKFCAEHDLPDAIVGPLTDHILENLKKAGKTLHDFGDDEPPMNANDATAQHPRQRSESGPAQQQSSSSGTGANSSSPTNSSCSGPANAANKNMGNEASSRLPARQAPLSFTGDPALDERVYEQLSCKLLPVDDSRMLTVNSCGSMNARKGSSIGSGAVLVEPRRKSQSADPSPRDSVHMRLYSNAMDQRQRAEARRKMAAAEAAAVGYMGRSSMSWISQEMMRERSHGPFDNYGEMLYAEGLEAAALRRSKAAAVKAERASKEMEAATFHPEITKLAKALWAGGDLESQPVWQRLSISKRAKTLERIEEMRQGREEAEVRECTFKPRINKHSSELMAERCETLKVLHISAHEQLFQDAVRRQHKMEELANWFPDDVTFKPAINKDSTAQRYLHHSLDKVVSSPEGSASSGSGANAGSSVTVVDRLYANYEKTKAKLAETRARFQGPMDPQTGRPLYQPQIGRGPQDPAVRKKEGVPVHEHLYAVAQERKSKKEAVLQAEKQQAEMEANMNHSTNLSQRLFKRLKDKRFSQIFEYLDEEQSGLLDVVGLARQPTAHMDNLDNEVREDVELAAEIHAKLVGVPIIPDSFTAATINAAAQNGAPASELLSTSLAALPPAPPVSLEQFSSLMEETLRLRRGPRSYLVPSPASKYAPNHSFKPAINKRSKELAARLRPPELSLHEILHHNAEAVRCKLEHMRREREEAAMTGCTFAPKLNQNRAGVESRVRSNRPWSRSNSATASPRAAAHANAAEAAGQEHGNGNGGHAAYSGNWNEANGSAPAMEQFLALEHEVEEALAGVSLAQQKLDDISPELVIPHAVDSTGANGAAQPMPRMSARPGAAAAQASAVLHAQLGSDVDAADLRATEEMLLDLLTGSEGSDPSSDALMLTHLHKFLAQTSDGLHSPPANSADSLGTHVRSGSKGGASAAGSPASVNMFVVADALGVATTMVAPARTRMEDLAQSLAHMNY